MNREDITFQMLKDIHEKRLGQKVFMYISGPGSPFAMQVPENRLDDKIETQYSVSAKNHGAFLGLVGLTNEEFDALFIPVQDMYEAEQIALGKPVFKTFREYKTFFEQKEKQPLFAYTEDEETDAIHRATDEELDDPITKNAMILSKVDYEPEYLEKNFDALTDNLINTKLLDLISDQDPNYLDIVAKRA